MVLRVTRHYSPRSHGCCADGKTVLVSTFSCGLYLMEGLDSDAPSGRLVASFPRKPDTYCAIPVISGHFYLVTVPA